MSHQLALSIPGGMTAAQFAATEDLTAFVRDFAAMPPELQSDVRRYLDANRSGLAADLQLVRDCEEHQRRQEADAAGRVAAGGVIDDPAIRPGKPEHREPRRIDWDPCRGTRNPFKPRRRP